jgi:hypothetical protein
VGVDIMGHDTYAYFPKEITRLRRSAFDTDKRTIYDVLKANEFYGSASGNGGYKLYYRDEINEALLYARKENLPEDIINFLEECSGEEWVLIQFG